MSDRLDYLIEDFDLRLREGHPPVEAWARTLEGYAYVFHGKEGTELSRAAERALEALVSPARVLRVNDDETGLESVNPMDI